MLVQISGQPAGIRILVSRLLSPLLAPYESADETPFGFVKTNSGLQSESENSPKNGVNIMEVDILTLAVSLPKN